MPNLTPQEWNDRTRSNPGYPSGVHACLNVEIVDDGVVLTSTLGGDRGRLFLDTNEWSAAIRFAKTGQYDPTLAVVPV